MAPFDPLLPGPPLSAPLLPVAGLPAEAVSSLRRAFARETRARLPRLLDFGHGVAAQESLALARTDARMLAEGCALLGDAAGARALRHLEALLSDGGDPEARKDAAQVSALLLGRWTHHVEDGPAPQPA